MEPLGWDNAQDRHLTAAVAKVLAGRRGGGSEWPTLRNTFEQDRMHLACTWALAVALGTLRLITGHWERTAAQQQAG